MFTIGSPTFYFHKSFLPRQLAPGENPTPDEIKTYGRWCCFKDTGKTRRVVVHEFTRREPVRKPVYPKENTFESALELSISKMPKIRAYKCHTCPEPEIDDPDETHSTSQRLASSIKKLDFDIRDTFIRYEKISDETIDRLTERQDIKKGILFEFLRGHSWYRRGDKVFDFSRMELQRLLPEDMFAIYELAESGGLIGCSESILDICREILDMVARNDVMSIVANKLKDKA